MTSHRYCRVDLVGGGRCERAIGHRGDHAVGGQPTQADPSVVRLNQSQYDALRSLIHDARPTVPPATRKWLMRRGWVAMSGLKVPLSHPRAVVITESGRSAFQRAIKDWDTGKKEQES